MGICSDSKSCSLSHGQAEQKTGEGPLPRCGVLRYDCYVGNTSLRVSGFTKGTISWWQPSIMSTLPVHWDNLSVLQGVVCDTKEWRDCSPSIFCIALPSRAVVWELTEYCVQDESQHAQPTADRGTQSAPDPKGLYLTEEVMTVTIFFPVQVNSNPSSGILGMSHLCTKQHCYFGS